MLYRLLSLVTFALVSLCLVVTVEVCSDADSARSHLRDDGIDRSRKVLMHLEGLLVRLCSKSSV